MDRRILVDQAFRIQRERSLNTIAVQEEAQQQLGTVRIGQRDAATGRSKVLHGAGAETTNGVRIFSGSVPVGLNLKATQAYGQNAIALDYRSHVPVVEEFEEISKPVKKGTAIMVFDSDWLSLVFTNPASLAGHYQLFRNLVRKLCKNKILYTLPASSGSIFRENGFVFSLLPTGSLQPYFQLAIEVLEQEEIEIIESSLNEAKGPFFLPLLFDGVNVSAEALQAIGRKHGLILMGEHGPWVGYNNRLLAALSKTIVSEGSLVAHWQPAANGHPLAQGVSEVYAPGSAFATGFKPQELVLQVEPGKAGVVAIEV